MSTVIVKASVLPYVLYVNTYYILYVCGKFTWQFRDCDFFLKAKRTNCLSRKTMLFSRQHGQAWQRPSLSADAVFVCP